MRGRALDRLVELLAINRALAAAVDYHALVRLVVDKAADFLDADIAVLVMTDEHGEATIAAARGLDPSATSAFKARFDERIGARICELIACTPDRFFASPVVEAGIVRGMLAVFRRHAPSADTEAALLSALADQVAIALGNALHMRRLEEALATLRDADRRKDEFLGMLSHELRNPLAPIRYSVFLLNRAGTQSETAVYARQVIERQTEHLTRLIDDLLDVTRIARGKVSIAREPVDISDVARRAADDHGPLFAERGIAMSLEIPQQAAWVVGDETRIAQVLANLLANAAKFTPAGGRVGMTVASEASNVEIRVQDSGAGIDPSLRTRVFEPFVQSDKTLARSGGGLGLGLALVKGVVQLHGGTVEAESAGVGQGSEFVIRLPRLAPPETLPMPAARTSALVHPKRVLIIEDHRDAAESLARLVSLLGHTSYIAHDGPTGFEMIQASQPDVVLCDIGLPGMSGYELVKQIRERGLNGARLIAISGYAQPEDVRRAIDAGFDAHVAKPPDPGEIHRLLSHEAPAPPSGSART
jgi:signal transduction histidine kinase/ActR/RegA family two-component response regulator